MRGAAAKKRDGTGVWDAETRWSNSWQPHRGSVNPEVPLMDAAEARSQHAARHWPNPPCLLFTCLSAPTHHCEGGKREGSFVRHVRPGFGASLSLEVVAVNWGLGAYAIEPTSCSLPKLPGSSVAAAALSVPAAPVTCLVG